MKNIINELSKETLKSYISKRISSHDKKDNPKLEKAFKKASAKSADKPKVEAPKITNTFNETRLYTPLKGHPYHTKTDAELHYIIKDAGSAARAMKDHDPKAEAKYLDQVNDASTVLAHRRRGGKQLAKEEVVTEISKDVLKSYKSKAADSESDANEKSKSADKAGDHNKANDLLDKVYKRQQGIKKAKAKLGEETIDEVSSKILKRYISKSVKDVKAHNHQLDWIADKNDTVGNDARDEKQAEKSLSTINRRKEYMKKAKAKLGEETIDEMGVDKLKNYADISSKNKARAEGMRDREWDKGHFRDAYKAAKTAEKRTSGVALAKNKLEGKAKVPAHEENLNVEEGKTFKDRKDDYRNRKSGNLMRALKKNSAMKSAARRNRNNDEASSDQVDEASYEKIGSYLKKSYMDSSRAKSSSIALNKLRKANGLPHDTSKAKIAAKIVTSEEVVDGSKSEE